MATDEGRQATVRPAFRRLSRPSRHADTTGGAGSVRRVERCALRPRSSPSRMRRAIDPCQLTPKNFLYGFVQDSCLSRIVCVRIISITGQRHPRALTRHRTLGLVVRQQRTAVLVAAKEEYGPSHKEITTRRWATGLLCVVRARGTASPLLTKTSGRTCRERRFPFNEMGSSRHHSGSAASGW